MITILIKRSREGCSECIRVDRTTSSTYTFFPDAEMKDCSDFPCAGISIHLNQGHLIFSNNSREKWVFSTSHTEVVDLGFFSPEWHGSNALVMMMT
jgi:hypothetical protein